METRKIGVVGASNVGAGIAQLCAQNGLEVLLVDETQETLGQAEGMILRGLHRAEQPAAFSLLRKSTNLRALGDCDFVIESAYESLAVKQNIFRKIDPWIKSGCILATNTSALPVGLLASVIENPQRVVGMHFFHPASVMRLVEIVASEQSSQTAVRQTLDLASRLGRVAVRSRDVAGFIVQRVSRPFFLVSLRLLEQGRTTPALLDAALRERGGLSLGPLEFMDMLGLEESLAVCATLYDLLGRPERLKPGAILEKLISRGCRGRKNSRGFYVYGENPPGTVNPLLSELISGLGEKPMAAPEAVKTVLEGVIAEAHFALQDKVAGREDIDTAMRLGLAWPKGPFEWEKTLLKS